MRRTAPGEEAAAGASHLQYVVEQGDAALVGLGFGELQQGADLETLGVPSVTSLEGTDDWRQDHTRVGLRSPQKNLQSSAVKHCQRKSVIFGKIV